MFKRRPVFGGSSRRATIRARRAAGRTVRSTSRGGRRAVRSVGRGVRRIRV
jgi:hypothetical protein